MFTGQFIHNLDEKFRLTIPSTFRGTLQNGFALTPGPKGSVYIYTKDRWEKIAEKLNTLPDTQKNQSLKRYMFSRTKIEYNVDKAGRVMIPEVLRIHGNIKKSVAVVGDGARLVIWPAEIWREIDTGDAESFDGNYESMAALGAI